MKLAVVLGLLLLSLACQEALGRDRAQRTAFQHSHPCPSTGKRSGPCPGYVVDHIRPLCAGGPDRQANLQWQTVPEAKVKDRAELTECRALRSLAK